MDTGIERVTARISEIEAKISQLSGAAEQPSGGGGSFAQALNSAQNAPTSAGESTNNLPPLPVAPDGETVRPLPASSASQFAPLVQQSAGKYGVDPGLVSAVIQAESGGNPSAVSSAGAMGLMQLMPETVSESGIDNPFDPAENIDAGTRKLSGLLNEYGGNVDLALAAYNAGKGAVQRYGGVPPYRETQTYIRRIHRLMGNG